MDTVLVERDGPVTIIRINRLDKRNAIDKVTATALRAAWQAFDADNEAAVGVLTGTDSIFCAGADLGDVEALAADVNSVYGPLGFSRISVSKPTIAAVSGYAVAGGLELACWCDMRIGDATAVFGCFERRFGVPLIDGGTQRLPRIVGLGRALEMILTGRAVNADEAHSIGLLNEVVSGDDTPLARAVALGKALAAFPQVCVRNDRQAVYDGLGTALVDGLGIEAQRGADTIASGEAQRGAGAFQRGSGRGGSFNDGS